MRFTVLFVVCLTTTLLAASRGTKPDARVEKGLNISPVSVNPTAANRNAVGLGSYLVNAVAGCANCHTCPTYVPGHSKGKDKEINSQNFMAGGVPFNSSSGPGPAVSLTSANLTPDSRGVPGGLTFLQFQAVFTEGHKTLAEAYSEVPSASPGFTGQVSVMPWRIYQNLDAGDLQAIYAYLKAIPAAKPGTCNGPGE